MNALLSECQQWLANRYASAGISFDQDNSPRWRVVSRDNLTDSTPVNERTAGVVEDGEIGLLLYLLPLAEEAKSIVEQVTADINLALKIRSRLLPQYSDSGSDTPNEASDDLLGTWRVCLHWLIPTKREEEWRDAVMHARQQSSAFDEVEQIAEEPDAWESVRKTFQDLTQRIIAAHLPNTLERVWWEIAANLTSAPSCLNHVHTFNWRFAVVISGSI